MSKQSNQTDGGQYRIRIAGHLSPNWAERLGGLAISQLSNGDSQLCGHIPDQAALHGLLRILRDSGVTLIGVERVSPKPTVILRSPA